MSAYRPVILAMFLAAACGAVQPAKLLAAARGIPFEAAEIACRRGDATVAAIRKNFLTE